MPSPRIWSWATSRNVRWTMLLGAIMLWLVAAPISALAQAPYDDETTPEGWAWKQIKEGEEADFNLRCKTPVLNPNQTDEKRWTDQCRALASRFVTDVLSRPPWREQVGSLGVSIIGARITGSINLENAKLDHAMFIAGSRVDGNVDLRHARTDSELEFNGSRVAGQFWADGLHAEQTLGLRHGSRLMGNVSLVAAKIDGNLSLAGATFDGSLNAHSLQVGGDLQLFPWQGKPTNLREVSLEAARIAGSILMESATVLGELDAEGIQVGHSFIMDGVHCSGPIDMVVARIGRTLALPDATLAGLNLSGAWIDGDFVLTRMRMSPIEGQLFNGRTAGLVLWNTRVGSLVDTQDAWPMAGQLYLDGFSFAHLGGYEGETAPQMRDRGMAWWDAWARRDSTYSPSPYTQLAAAFTAMGDQSGANEIRFRGRVRERETRCAEHAWASCISLLALEYVAGYGIGSYTFQIGYWVFDLSLIGAWMLWRFVPAARQCHRGRLWCCGASVSRLLPLIEINKEFTDFFNDPDRRRLNGWQTVAFSLLHLAGWVLGAIWTAAVSGWARSS